MTAITFAVATSACPQQSAVPATRETAVIAAAARPANAAATPWSAVLVRPRSGVEATGVGYAAGFGTGTRRGLDRAAIDAKGFTGKTSVKQSKQQDQLHLMSRRDPRTWRPPA